MSSPFESSRLEVTSSIADRPTVASVAGASEGEVSKTSFVSAAGLSVNFPFHGRGPESRLALIRSHVGSHPCPFQDIWRNQHNSRCGNSTTRHGARSFSVRVATRPIIPLCLCGATGRTTCTPWPAHRRTSDSGAGIRLRPGWQCADHRRPRNPSMTTRPARRRWHPARSRWHSAKDTCAPMQRACNLHRKRLSGGMQLQELAISDVPRAGPNGDPASRRD